MSEKATEVTQREMIRIIGLFRKQGFKGNYLSFQHVVDEGATYFVVMGDENNGNQGLFKANLLTGEVAFQYMLDEDHVVTKQLVLMNTAKLKIYLAQRCFFVVEYYLEKLVRVKS